MAYLLCREHPKPGCIGQPIDLAFPTMSLGRSRWADIRIDDATVPARAAELKWCQDGEIRLFSFDPRILRVNAAGVDGECVLNAGDFVQVGPALFEFCESTEEALPEETEEHSSLLVRFLQLAMGTFASRCLGLVREVAAAALIGASGGMDFFITAFTVPSLFRRMLGEAAMESAFLPTFRSYLSRGRTRDAWLLASTLFNLLAILLTGLTLTLYLLAPFVVSVLAPGYGQVAAEQTVALTRLILPFALFIGLAAFLGSVLLARKRMFAYSLAPTMFSFGQIAGLLLFYRSLGVYSLAVGVLLGGAGQMLVQLHALRSRSAGNGYSLKIQLRHPGVRKVVSLMGPVFVTTFVDKLGGVAKRVIASFLAAGTLAAFNYAFRLAFLPFSMISLAVSRAVLPQLAEVHARNDTAAFRHHLGLGIRLVLFLMLPVSTGMAVLSSPIVETVLAHGAWNRSNPEATGMTALALVFFAVSLPWMSLVSLLTRAFHAMLETRAPLRVACWGMVVNVVVSILLAWQGWGAAGFAIAIALDFALQTALLAPEMKRRLAGPEAPFSFSGAALSFLPCGVATATMGGAVWFAAGYWWCGPAGSIAQRLFLLAGLIGLGAAVYAAGSLLLGVPEMMLAVRRFSARRRNRHLD